MPDNLPTTFALLRVGEYHTLLNKGLLHALPASRFLTTSQTEDYAAWHKALPEGEDLRSRPWLLLGISSDKLPLDIRHADLRHTYRLDEQQAQEMLLNLSASSSASGAWFKNVLDAIRTLLRVRAEYPYGVLVVPRLGDERPERLEYLPFSKEQFIAPDQIRQNEAWNRAIPDIDDDNYAVILPLKQPIGNSPAHVDSQFTRAVIPLTQRGAILLQEQSGYKSLPASPKLPGEVLLSRRRTEAIANAIRLYDLISALLKPAERNKIASILTELENAADVRRQREMSMQAPEQSKTPATFWEALFDYDRTGQNAEDIHENSRGFLLDLGFIARSFLKSQKDSNKLNVDSKIIGIALNEWGQIAQNPALDDSAFTVFKPKSSATVTSKTLNAHLTQTGFNSLATGFQFLYLLRYIGQHEQEFTPDILEQMKALAKGNSLMVELALALYAIGLALPSGKFLATYRTLLPTTPSAIKTKPVSASTRKGSAKQVPEPSVAKSEPIGDSTETPHEVPYDPAVVSLDNAEPAAQWGPNGA